MNKERSPSFSQGEYPYSEENHDSGERESDQEILNGKTAKSVLPYLTLDMLSDHEKAQIICLAEEALSNVASNPPNLYTRIEYTEYIEEKTASLAGEEEAWTNRTVPKKLGEARKLLCSCILNGYNQCKNTGSKNDISLANNIRQTFFGFTPSIDSYCGNLKDNLEMLSISERSNDKMCTQTLYSEIIYDYSFTDENGFDDVLKHASPIEQLRLMPVIYSVSRQCWADSWNNRALDKIYVAYGHLAYNKGSAPLVKLIAEGLGKKIDERLLRYGSIVLDSPEYVVAKLENKEQAEKTREKQSELHQYFPNLPESSYLEMIAPGVAGAFNGARLSEISDKKGVMTSLLEYDPNNAFGIDSDSAQLLIALHDLEVKDYINKELGLDLANVSLDAQMQLLKYMAKSGDDRFDKLCNTLRKTDEKLRLELAESFLAAGFGEDFGDALLDIANSKRFSGEQLGEILGQIESCRDSIRKITEMYKDYDGGKFASEYSKAANERLTDAITVFQEIARNGTATANLDWAGTPKFTYNSAMEALKYEAKSLSIISGTVSDVATGKEGAFAELLLTPDDSRTRSMYSFYSPEHGYVLLYTRPEASSTYENSLEYGNRSGVEASISLITNPVNPFELPTPFKPNPKAVRNPNYYDPATMDRVSAIRIDREGRTLDMVANDPRRHPLNHEGIASVDLAAIGDRADTPSGKIARLFSVGNALRAARVGGEIKLNHNTNWFDQDKFGTDVGFKSVADYVDRLAITWCAEHPSSEDQGFRAATRQARPSAKRRRSAA